MPDPSLDGSVRVPTDELVGVGAGRGMRRTVRVPFERDGRDGDDGPFCELSLELLVLRPHLGQAQPPAVVVDRDGNVVRVVQRGCAASEGGVVEVPLRRGSPPDELGEFVPVLVVADSTAFGREVVLVPPLQLGLRRKRRRPAPGSRSDSRSPRPGPCSAPARSRDDARRPRAPVEAGDDGGLDVQGVEQPNSVDRQRGLLAVAHCVVGEEARRPKPRR